MPVFSARVFQFSARLLALPLLFVICVGAIVPTTSLGVESSSVSSQTLLSPEAMRTALEYTVEKVNAVSTTTDQKPDPVFQDRYAALSKLIDHPLPAYEFANSLNRLLGSLRDAHTFVEFAQAQRRLPIRARWLQDGLIVTESTDSLLKGDRIVKVGLFQTKDLLRKLYEITPSENEFFVRGRAPSIVLSEEFLRSIQAVDSNGMILIGFERQGQGGLVRMSLEPETSSIAAQPWYAFTFDDKQALAQIRLDRCDYDADFASALRSFMHQVQERKVEKLVIDLRDNRGGDALVAFALAAYIDPDYRSFSLRVRRSQELLNGVPAYAQFLTDANRVPGSRNLHELTADVVKAVSLARLGSDATVEPERRFRGQVYLLTSPLTFSSANLFATLFKDNKLATIVGEPTGNEIDFRGEGVLFDIPGTPLRLSVSATRYQRPDREQGNSPTLMPDILIPLTREHVLNGSDPQLDAIGRRLSHSIF